MTKALTAMMMVLAASAWTLTFAQDDVEESAAVPEASEVAAEAAVEQATVETAPEATVEQASAEASEETVVAEKPEKPEKAKKEKVKKEKPEKVKAEKTAAEGKSKVPLWAAVSLDVAGAGLIVAGIVANDKVSQYVSDNNVKGAKLWASRRNIGYIAGAALLAGGITIHILF